MLKPPDKFPLDPDMQFRGPSTALSETPFFVRDFWRWAFSDFQQNIIRGILAEFLVAKALDLNLSVRFSWANYDLETPEGIKIEVKAGGYLQSWKQQKPSKVTFTGLRARLWCDETGYASEPSYRADVFVFGLQTAVDHAAFDPLDIGQWQFWVVSRATIEKQGTNSLSLSVLEPVRKFDCSKFDCSQVAFGK